MHTTQDSLWDRKALFALRGGPVNEERCKKWITGRGELGARAAHARLGLQQQHHQQHAGRDSPSLSSASSLMSSLSPFSRLWCHSRPPTMILHFIGQVPCSTSIHGSFIFLFQLNYSHFPQTGGNRHPLAQLHSIGHKVMLLPWMLKLKKLEMDLGRRAGCVFGGRCWFKKCLWLEVVVRVEVFPQQCNVAIRLRAASHHHHTTFSPPQQHHHYYYFYKYYYSYSLCKEATNSTSRTKRGKSRGGRAVILRRL